MTRQIPAVTGKFSHLLSEQRHVLHWWALREKKPQRYNLEHWRAVRWTLDCKVTIKNAKNRAMMMEEAVKEVA
jgi:hypothetical protein